MQRKNQEVDWSAYFKSIRSVCPHSLESFQGNRIHLVPFYYLFHQAHWYNALDRFDAILFIGDNKVSLGLLKNLVDYLEKEYKHLEVFYSYPDEGTYSTPKPTIIMQKRIVLQRARREYKQKLKEQ